MTDINKSVPTSLFLNGPEISIVSDPIDVTNSVGIATFTGIATVSFPGGNAELDGGTVTFDWYFDGQKLVAEGVDPETGEDLSDVEIVSFDAATGAGSTLTLYGLTSRDTGKEVYFVAQFDPPAYSQPYGSAVTAGTARSTGDAYNEPVTSVPASVTVYPELLVDIHPYDVANPTEATFSTLGKIEPEEPRTISYQWQIDGEDINDGTNIVNIKKANEGFLLIVGDDQSKVILDVSEVSQYNNFNPGVTYILVAENDITVKLYAVGAAGGNGRNGNSRGGFGGGAQGTFTFKAGQPYTLIVGKQGSGKKPGTSAPPEYLAGLGGKPGGGNSGYVKYRQSVDNPWGAGGGGGFTGLFIGEISSDFPASAQSSAILIAGGGGGGGSEAISIGGDGGGNSGVDGYNQGGRDGGEGGTQNSGGNGGVGGVTTGEDGSALSGGDGNTGGRNKGVTGGAGGGGGYYGGGAGGSGRHGGAAYISDAGGGGSGYINTNYISDGIYSKLNSAYEKITTDGTKNGSFKIDFGTGPSVVEFNASGTKTENLKISSLVNWNPTLVGTSIVDSAGGPGKLVKVFDNTINSVYPVYREYTWTVPSGTTSIQAVLVGGGGGGERYWRDVAGRNYPGGGGGGGALVVSNDIPVTEGEELTIRVGAGGYGGFDFIGSGLRRLNYAQDGGTSQILRGSTVLISAEGGKGAGELGKGGRGGQAEFGPNVLGGGNGGKGGDGFIEWKANSKGKYTDEERANFLKLDATLWKTSYGGGGGGAGGYDGDGGDGCTGPGEILSSRRLSAALGKNGEPGSGAAAGGSRINSTRNDRNLYASGGGGVGIEFGSGNTGNNELNNIFDRNTINERFYAGGDAGSDGEKGDEYTKFFTFPHDYYSAGNGGKYGGGGGGTTDQNQGIYGSSWINAGDGGSGGVAIFYRTDEKIKRDQTELSGFITDDGSSLLFMGQYNTTAVTKERTATWTIDATDVSSIVFRAIIGNDRNGGESPNSNEENLSLVLTSRVAGRTKQYSREVIIVPYNSEDSGWKNYRITLLPEERTGNLTLKLRAPTKGRPEFSSKLTQSIIDNNQGAGDAYGIDWVRTYDDLGNLIKQYNPGGSFNANFEVRCKLSAPDVQESPVYSDIADYVSREPKNILGIEVYNYENATADIIEHDLDEDGELKLDYATYPGNAICFYAKEKDVIVDIELHGSKGKDYTLPGGEVVPGGNGGSSYIRLVMKKNEEYVVTGLFDSVGAPFIYRKSSLIAVVGGGGDAGRVSGAEGGHGGGIGLSGLDSKSQQNSSLVGLGAKNIATGELGGNGIFGSALSNAVVKELIEVYPEDSVQTASSTVSLFSGGKTISHTKGEYYRQQGANASADIGQSKFRTPNGTEIEESERIERGFKAGYNIMQTRGGVDPFGTGEEVDYITDPLIDGEIIRGTPLGGAGATGGSVKDFNSAAGGGSGYTDGSVEVIDTTTGFDFSNRYQSFIYSSNPFGSANIVISAVDDFNLTPDNQDVKFRVRNVGSNSSKLISTFIRDPAFGEEFGPDVLVFGPKSNNQKISLKKGVIYIHAGTTDNGVLHNIDSLTYDKKQGNQYIQSSPNIGKFLLIEGNTAYPVVWDHTSYKVGMLEIQPNKGKFTRGNFDPATRTQRITYTL